MRFGKGNEPTDETPAEFYGKEPAMHGKKRSIKRSKRGHKRHGRRRGKR